MNQCSDLEYGSFICSGFLVAKTSNQTRHGGLHETLSALTYWLPWLVSSLQLPSLARVAKSRPILSSSTNHLFAPMALKFSLTLQHIKGSCRWSSLLALPYHAPLAILCFCNLACFFLKILLANHQLFQASAVEAPKQRLGKSVFFFQKQQNTVCCPHSTVCYLYADKPHICAISGHFPNLLDCIAKLCMFFMG